MRDKLQPWVAAIFCASLSLITIVGNIAAMVYTNGVSQSPVTIVFLCFLPMCFYHVGDFLFKLRQENRDLQKQVAALTEALGAKGG